MEKIIKLSIVTPTFNQASYIADTFNSILCQKFEKGTIEYIVVDALSTDNTEQIVASFSKKFRSAGVSFRYIREKDSGQSNAVNKGWKISRGEYLTYLNSDDFYTPNAIEDVLSTISSNAGIEWFYGGWNIVSEQKKLVTTFRPKLFSFNKLLMYCNIGQPSCFFKRTALFSAGMLNEDLHLSMDYDLWLKLASHSQPLVLPTILSNMRYYQNTKSSTRTSDHLIETFGIASKYTRPFSFLRLSQIFYFVRGYVLFLLKIDFNRRVSSGHFQFIRHFYAK